MGEVALTAGPQSACRDSTSSHILLVFTLGLPRVGVYPAGECSQPATATVAVRSVSVPVLRMIEHLPPSACSAYLPSLPVSRLHTCHLLFWASPFIMLTGLFPSIFLLSLVIQTCPKLHRFFSVCRRDLQQQGAAVPWCPIPRGPWPLQPRAEPCAFLCRGAMCRALEDLTRRSLEDWGFFCELRAFPVLPRLLQYRLPHVLCY